MTNPFDTFAGPSRPAVAARPVVRTDRPYVVDLRDAYNLAMSDEHKRQGLEWYVTPMGELKLGTASGFTNHLTKVLARDREAERQRWIERHNTPQIADRPTHGPD